MPATSTMGESGRRESNPHRELGKQPRPARYGLILQLGGHGHRPWLSVDDRCGPMRRARRGHGRRARQDSKPNSDGHQLGRRARAVPGDHLPCWQLANGDATVPRCRLGRTEAVKDLFHDLAARMRSFRSEDDFDPEIAACFLEPDDVARLVGTRCIGLVHRVQIERLGPRGEGLGIEQRCVGGRSRLQQPQQSAIGRHRPQRTLWCA